MFHGGIDDEERLEVLALLEHVEDLGEFALAARGDGDAAAACRHRLGQRLQRDCAEGGVGLGGLGGLLRVQVSGGLVQINHLSADFLELLQQFQCGAADGQHLRQHRHAVFGDADLKDGLGAFANDLGEACQVVLVAVVEIQVIGQQDIAHVNHGCVEGLLLVGRDLRFATPGGLDGMHHEDVAEFLAQTQCGGLVREVVLHQRVVGIPGGLEGDAGGVVALGLGGHGIPREMRAAEVDAEHRQPVAQGLVSREGEVPASHAVAFAEARGLVELMRHAGALLGGVDGIPGLAEEVNAGLLLIFVEAHRGAHAFALREHVVLAEDMASVFEVVLSAPVADELSEVLHEERGGHFVEVMAGLGELHALHIIAQLEGVVQHIVAKALLEGLGERLGPRHGVEEAIASVDVVGFVGEDAGDGRPEVLAVVLEVGLVGDFQELLDGFRVHRVQVGLVVEPAGGDFRMDIEDHQFTAGGGFRRKRLHALRGNDGLAVLREFRHKIRQAILSGRLEVRGFRRALAPQPADAVLGVLGDQTAGRSGGPAVLVIEPRLHLELLRFVRAGADAFEPLLA